MKKSISLFKCLKKGTLPIEMDLFHSLERDGIKIPEYIKENYKGGKKLEDRKCYESIIIINSKLDENQVNKIIEDYKNYFESLSKNEVETENLGKKNLAYEVRGNKEGYYALFKFDSTREDITNVEKKYRMDDNVIKFITIRSDKEYEEPENIKKDTLSKKSKDKKVKDKSSR